MKKLLSLLLVFVMVFAFAVPASAETETPTFVVSEETAAPGEEVRVSISIKNNTGIASAALTAVYDHDVLELTNVERGEYTGGNWLAMQPNFDADWVDYVNDYHDGLFATLVFNVKEDAPTGDSEVSVSYRPNDVFDEDEENVYFAIQAGKVTVTGGETPSDTPTFVVSEETAAPGEEVRVSISIKNNTGIASVALTAVYDHDVLELTNVERGEYTGGQWLAMQPNFDADWVDYVNDYHDGLFATLVFNVKADAPTGDSAVSVSYRPNDVFDEDEENVYFDIQPGKVTVTAPEEPEFMTQSLLLDGSLGVIFYVRLPERDGYVYQNVTFTISSAEGETVVPFTSDLPKNDNGYYGFTYSVRSIQMADTIMATLNYTVDGAARTLEKEYTVKEYFLTYDDNKDLFTEKQQNMTEAVADYGHYVQAFLDTTRDWNVPDDYADMDKFYKTYGDAEKSEATEALVPYAIDRQMSEDITDIKFTLVLDSTTELRVFFKPASTYTGDVTFEVDGSDATAEKLSDGRYVIKITNIAAHELSKTHTIKATTDNGLAKAEVSGLSYAQAMLAAYAGNTKAENAAIALYRYSMFADALKN